jgi:ubiquinone/menaquinone biosynthesis C-methylase UbiE
VSGWLEVEAKVQRWVQRRGWDRAVGYYQTFWQEQLRPAHERVLAAADLRPGQQVIDVACGTGMVTLPAAAAVGPVGHVLATDLSRRMVDDTARRARLAGLDNVEVHRCDAEQLDASGPFDVALCSLGLMYVPFPRAAVCEMRRVLSPGGVVVVSVWGERRNCGWAELFPIVAARVSSDVCPLFFALGTSDGLADLIERADFTDVEQTRLSVDLVYADDAAALGAAFLGGPVALAYSRFDDATKTSAHDDYLASIAPYRDGSGYRVPGEFVIASGRRP